VPPSVFPGREAGSGVDGLAGGVSVELGPGGGKYGFCAVFREILINCILF
jgi:hypothetical protein